MLESEKFSCLQHIVQALAFDCEPEDINLLTQEDEKLLLFYWYCQKQNKTYIGSHHLSFGSRARARSFMPSPMGGAPGEIDLAASVCPVGSVRLLCKLSGHPDIVHMTVDKQLKVLAIVFRTLDKKVFRYDVEVVDRLQDCSGESAENCFTIALEKEKTTEMVKAYFLREDAASSSHPNLYLLVMALGKGMWLYKISCEAITSLSFVSQYRILKNRCHRILTPSQISTACDGFLWAQWEPRQKRVYFLTINAGATQTILYLQGREYRGADNPEHVRSFLSVPLIIEENGRTTSNVFGHGQAFSIKNFRPEYRTQDVGIGADTIPLSDALSWNFINARVLAQSNGTFSLCVQLLKSQYKSREVLRYSVVAFHHLMTQEIVACEASHEFERRPLESLGSLINEDMDDVSSTCSSVRMERRATQSGSAFEEDVGKALQEEDQRRESINSTSGKIIETNSRTDKILNVDPNRILFVLFNHYIIAALPGSFLHMLDNGEEHGPSHNIYLTAGQAGFLNDNMMRLTPVRFGSSQRPYTFFFDATSQNFHQLSVNYMKFLQLFSRTTDEQKRMALVHYACMHSTLYRSQSEVGLSISQSTCKNETSPSLEKAILGMVADDVSSVESPQILTEYIIASAYHKFTRVQGIKLATNVAKLFPYCSPTMEAKTPSRDNQQFLFRDGGDLDDEEEPGDEELRSPRGSRLSSTRSSGNRFFFVAEKCSRIPQVEKFFPGDQPIWDATSTLMQKAKYENFQTIVPDPYDTKWKKMKNGRISLEWIMANVSCSCHMPGRSKYIPKASQLQFLKPNHFTSVPNLAAKLYVVILSLLTELKKPKGASKIYPDSKNHLDEACEIYTSLLMDQTMTVLQTFWDQLSLGQSDVYVNWGVISMETNLTALEAKERTKSLSEKATFKEKLLLECYLRVQMAVESFGFQCPDGFQDFIFSLGLRSYPVTYFCMALDAGVFKLSPVMCRRVFEELNENAGKNGKHFDPNICSLKFEILTRYDALRPLIEPFNTFDWDIGRLVSQDLILTKKLCDVTGYAADKVGVREHHPWSPSTASSFASQSSTTSHINRSESVDSFSGYPPHPGPAGHSTSGYKDLIAEARNNFQIYLDSKIKNAPQLLPTPASLNTADVNDEETTWFSF